MSQSAQYQPVCQHVVQPIVYCPTTRPDTWRLVGFELLIRLIFVTGLERFFRALDRDPRGPFLMRRFLADAAVTASCMPPVVCSYNATPGLLIDPGIRVGRQLLPGTPKARTGIEIPENLPRRMRGELEGAATELMAQGYVLLRDDVRLGFDPVRACVNHPVHVVKTDRAIARAIHLPRIASALRALNEGLVACGSTAIVEGCETVEQLERFIELGFHHHQGYFLGRPASADDVAREWAGRIGAPLAYGQALKKLDEATRRDFFVAWLARLDAVRRDGARIEREVFADHDWAADEVHGRPYEPQPEISAWIERPEVWSWLQKPMPVVVDRAERAESTPALEDLPASDAEQIGSVGLEDDVPDASTLLELITAPGPVPPVSRPRLSWWAHFVRWWPLLTLLCALPAGAAGIERAAERESIVLTVVPALKAQVAADPAAAQRTASTLLRRVPAGGPASIALGEIVLDAEHRGLPRTRCDGVAVLYRWPSGLERSDGSGALQRAEKSAQAVGSALRSLGLQVRGLAGQETAGIPWSRIAPADADPLDPRGARAAQVWQRAVGACFVVEVGESGIVRVLP